MADLEDYPGTRGDKDYIGKKVSYFHDKCVILVINDAKIWLLFQQKNFTHQKSITDYPPASVVRNCLR